jgi:hypothetical protein
MINLPITGWPKTPPTKWDFVLEMVLTNFLKFLPIFDIGHGLCIHIISFQNSKYFEISLLMSFSFFIDFETSLPQIGQNGRGFGIPFGSLGRP